MGTASVAAGLRPFLDRPLFDGQFDADVAHARLADEFTAEIAAGGHDAHAGEHGALFIGHALPWDTAFFGVPCYRIDYLRLPESGRDMRWVVECLAAHDVRLCFLRTSVGDPARPALGSGPFRLMSTKLLMRRAPLTGAPDPAVVALTALPSDRRHDAVERAVSIAADRFDVGRFFADPAIGRPRATDVYVSWVRQAAASDPGHFLCLLNRDGGIAGVAICHRGARGGVEFGFLDLVATDGTIERAGARLLSAAEAMLSAEGLGRWFANVDLANTRAMRLYARSGFEPFHAVDEYHAWLT